MKPSNISKILDLAYVANNQGNSMNPMFEGHAGLGKSEIIIQWVKEKQKTNPNFGFVDFRLAYYEGPDFVGYPKDFQQEVIITVNGVETKTTLDRMKHCLPDFWPTEGEGLFCFEEPNRGNPMVMNALMQILTTKRVGTNYKCPDGWFFCAAQNQATAEYDTAALDTALADRFTIFQVDHDNAGFLAHIKEKKWHQPIIQMVESAMWLYKTPEQVGKEGKYISPRTLSKLNTAEKAGDFQSSTSYRSIHLEICNTILGKAQGTEYWNMCWDDAPVLAKDLINDFDNAIIKLQDQSGGENYAGDKINLTVENIIQEYSGYHPGLTNKDGDSVKEPKNKITEQQMVAVACIIPADQAVNLLKGAATKHVRLYGGRMKEVMKSLNSRHPELNQVLRSMIKVDRIKGDK